MSVFEAASSMRSLNLSTGSPRRHSRLTDLESVISASPSSLKKGRKFKPLPPQFRSEMPRKRAQNSASSTEKDEIPQMPAISASSFYGKAKSPQKTEEKSQEMKKKAKNVQKKKIMASSKPKKSKYGINKGVSHGIKKPKPQKPQKPPKTPKTPKISYKISPHVRSGNVKENVGFDFKCGEMKFNLRRSPRKGSYPHLAPTTPKSSLGKTPGSSNKKRLFTPTSKDNFLQPSPGNSPSRRKFIPSPVKFDKDFEDDEKENEEENFVENLIKDLDKTTSEDDYAVYVDQDELSTVAWAAVNEIEALDDITESLDPNEMPDLKLDLSSSPARRSPRNSSPAKIQTPLKSKNSSPAKILTPLKSKNSSPSKILTPLKSKNSSPTKILTPLKSKMSKDSSPTKILTPSKTKLQNPANPSPLKRRALLNNMESPNKKTKVFSIFQKGAKSGISEKSPQKKSSSRPKKLLEKSADQMIIDAGQKKIGSQQCKSCNVVFEANDLEDVKLHEAAHKKYLGIVAFSGWRNERIVFEDHENEVRIVQIKLGDPKRHWEKVNAVLEVVDRILGIETPTEVRQNQNPEVFLAIDSDEKRVVGCLVSEDLSASDQLSRSYLKQGSRVISDLKSRSGMIGVSRIWVHADKQRRGLASRMLTTMRQRRRFPVEISKNEIALSHTTEMGEKFAQNYFGKEDYLVYRTSQ